LPKSFIYKYFATETQRHREETEEMEKGNNILLPVQLSFLPSLN
jgi:hypothetical protein